VSVTDPDDRYDAMTDEELAEEADAEGLDSTGSRQELLDRLRAAR
jgi:hypothetical protein